MLACIVSTTTNDNSNRCCFNRIKRMAQPRIIRVRASSPAGSSGSINNSSTVFTTTTSSSSTSSSNTATAGKDKKRKDKGFRFDTGSKMNEIIKLLIYLI